LIRVVIRPVLASLVLLALCCASCSSGKRFYPVSGKVLVDGKPGEAVMVVFHPQEETEPPLLPSAVVKADGSFVLQSWIVDQRVLKDGAPAGDYRVTCVWYPPDLEKYLANATLPDRLHGKYSDKNQSGLQAQVLEGPTQLQPFDLTTGNK
jgi:hypothetical protein